PAHLLADRYSAAVGVGAPVWAIVPAAGVLLVVLIWLMGGMGSGRVHPVLLTYLLLMVLFGGALVPHTVLHPSRLFVGDVTHSAVESTARSEQAGKALPWVHLLTREPEIPADAIWREPASQQLIFYTSGTRSP